jgi:hypothetical protein
MTLRPFRVQVRGVLGALLALGALGLLSGPAVGQADARPDRPAAPDGVARAAAAPPATQQERDARVQERLLHARRGGVLRATSRHREGRWEYKDAEGWHALPAEMITAARPLADALREWGERRVAVRRDDLPGRVEVAAWGIEEGLYEEALLQLDGVLQEAPDQPEALALLCRDDLPIAIPSPHASTGDRTAGGTRVALDDDGGEDGGDDGGEAADPEAAARERLLAFAAGAPPALREMAVERMRELDGAPAARLREALLPSLTDRDAGRRAMAALALRRLAPDGEPLREPELGELMRRAVRDVGEEPRRQAALALRDAGEPALMLPVIGALEGESSALRTHAAEALGLMGHREAVEPLVERLLTLPATGGSGGFQAPRAHIFVGRQIAFVQGFDVEVAQNAAIGKPLVGTLQEGATLDVRVLGASTSGGYGYVREAAAIRSSLERLTGVRAGSTKTAWKAWWAAHKEQWPRAGAVETGAAAAADGES